MTKEDAITYADCLKNNYTINFEYMEDFCDMVIKAMEQEPCEDAISRADVKKYLSAPNENGDRVIYESDLDLLPPVTPYPKTERCKWIRYDYRTICPQNHDIDNPYWRIPEKRMDVLKYCPYCGKEIEVTE